jgi:hypothetical protein
VIAVEDRGNRREFGTADLPVTFGAGAADVTLDGAQGSIQIGRLDGVYFVQAGRGARNVRVGGEPLTGTRALKDGDVIAYDRARLTCALAGATLAVRIDWVVTAGDTAPPDLDELARGRSAAADVAITPIAFKPSAAATTAAGRRGISRATIGIGAAFALLAVIAWFAFTA